LSNRNITEYGTQNGHLPHGRREKNREQTALQIDKLHRNLLYFFNVRRAGTWDAIPERDEGAMGRGPSDPFRDLLSLQERMNQLFEESARRTGLRPHGDQWTPLVDILDTEEAIILTAEVPGLEIGDISLEVTNHYLTLRGQRLFPHGDGNVHYHQLERAYGSFERLFHLPDEIDQARINASLRDGVLKIVLPKQPAQHAYTIPVHTPEP